PTSTNHELVLLGQTPDDADDLGADGEGLFSGSTTHEARIDPGDGAGAEQSPAAGTPSPSSAPTVNKGRKRRCTSDVWDDMDKIFTIEGGREVRVGATCHYCKKDFAARTNIGTGHLSRHRDRCKRLHAPRQQRQSMLRYNPDGTVQM
ncbi:hypothetical protein BS78_08G116900, partial [Paspalum vaginatum]